MLLSSGVQRSWISLEVSNMQVQGAFVEHLVLIAVKALGHSLLSMDLLVGQDVLPFHVNVWRLEITELSDNLLGDLLSPCQFSAAKVLFAYIIWPCYVVLRLRHYVNRRRCIAICVAVRNLRHSRSTACRVYWSTGTAIEVQRCWSRYFILLYYVTTYAVLLLDQRLPGSINNITLLQQALLALEVLTRIWYRRPCNDMPICTIHLIEVDGRVLLTTLR